MQQFQKLGLNYLEVGDFCDLLIKANNEELTLLGGAVLAEIKKRKQNGIML